MKILREIYSFIYISMNSHIISLSQSQLEYTLVPTTARINKLPCPLHPLRLVPMLLYTKLNSSNTLLRWLPRSLEKITSLEIRIWMDDCIQVRLTPRAILFHPLDVCLVRPLKHSVASNVISLFFHIFSHTAQEIFIVDTCRLKQCGKVVNGEMSVWASVGLASAGGTFRENSLA